MIDEKNLHKDHNVLPGIWSTLYEGSMVTRFPNSYGVPTLHVTGEGAQKTGGNGHLASYIIHVHKGLLG